MPPDFVFPFQAEAIAVLRRAIEVNPADARAPYYLGNLLFDWQPDEAIKLWEKSVALDDSMPIVHRNLASAYSRQDKGTDKAIAELEKAISISDNYPIHFFELDQLYEWAGTAPEKRLAMLEKHQPAVIKRDDALSREIGLKIFAGKYDEAVELMTGRQFNVWEGGARFGVYDYWTDAHLLRGHASFAAKKYAEALADYQAAIDFPANLQVAKTRRGGRAAECAYWVATAYEALGQQEKAKTAFQESAAELPRTGQDDVLPTSDRSVLSYYRGLSLKKLGETDKAAAIFQQLIESGNNSLDRGASATSSASSATGSRPALGWRRRTTLSALDGLGWAKTKRPRMSSLKPSRPGPITWAQNWPWKGFKTELLPGHMRAKSNMLDYPHTF